jgi:hypothetical protein
MYRANTKHQQPSLLSDISTMPERQRTMLEHSWAGAFREHCFCRIDESIFAVLYSEKPSRPNVPVNVLVGLEILKSGMGWSDEEMYEAFLFDMQVRYALGYESLTDGLFAIRSLYHFRQRLSEYHQKQGVNLLEIAFETMTDGQVEQLEIRTTKLRMDSTQIASDIRDSSRLYLLVEGLRRLYHQLDEEEQATYAPLCEPYIKRESKHYTYGVKGRKATDEAIQAIGLVLAEMLGELQARYAEETVYQVIQRLFDDNYRLGEAIVVAKKNDEIGSSALQSLDDLEASFRRKAGEAYKGYVANITESCDEENEVQLILDVQVAPNNTDDAVLLTETMPSLVERTEVDILYTDGGYGSPEVDRVMNEHQVEQIQSAIRGNAPDPSKLSLADFVIEQDEQGKPTHLTCPAGQRVDVNPARTTGFVARFDQTVCATCPLQLAGRCRTKPQKRDPRYALNFTQEQVFWAQRRHRHRTFLATPGNPRAAVEASVRSVKHPFRQGKLPVRGQFRVSCMMIASAAMCNVRRIHRYLVGNGLWLHFRYPNWLKTRRFRTVMELNPHICTRLTPIRRFLRRPLCRLRYTCFSY